MMHNPVHRCGRQLLVRKDNAVCLRGVPSFWRGGNEKPSGAADQRLAFNSRASDGEKKEGHPRGGGSSCNPAPSVRVNMEVR